MRQETIKTEAYDFGRLTIGQRFIIGAMEEGSDVHLDVVSKIIDIARTRFGDDKWAYISNRVNSYSLQPMVHRQAAELEKNMIAFAVVTHDCRLADVEKRFAGERYKFSCFAELDDAIAWVKSVLAEQGGADNR